MDVDRVEPCLLPQPQFTCLINNSHFTVIFFGTGMEIQYLLPYSRLRFCRLVCTLCI